MPTKSSVKVIRAIYRRAKISSGLNKSRTTHIKYKLSIRNKPLLILAAACEQIDYLYKSLTGVYYQLF
jgi:hypothetical protein